MTEPTERHRAMAHSLLAAPDNPLVMGKPTSSRTARAEYLAGALAVACAEERERCARIAEQEANLFGGLNIQFISAAKFAADLAKDIADLIRSAE